MNNSLRQALRELHLSGLANSLEVRLQEARSHQLTHEQFLELILQDELNIRQQRLIERRKNNAAFREIKTLEDFDFSFNPAVKRQQIFDLATAQFVREKRDLLLLGPPGVGKSHLAQAIGYHAIKAGLLVLYRSIFDLVRELQSDQSPQEQQRTLLKYLKPDLLIIDDMGIKQLPPRSGEVLLEIVMRRYENRSTLMTSNRPIEEWGKLIGDVPATSAILDRFLHHAHIIQITGRSYRLRQSTAAPKTEKPDKKEKTK